jgi:transcriptional regulator with XRE-family HTH domain
MPVIEIDGLPYIAAEWLERRIYRDDVRAKRWRQEAGRMAKRTDADGVATHTAYLWHSLQAIYRVQRWRSNLARTLAAIENRQRVTRVGFGLLIRDRRIAAGMTLRDLAGLAGVDHKTILNIEAASFPPTPRTLDRVIAVRELGLSWDDVSPILLEANPADGRKHRKAKKKRHRRVMHPAALSARRASAVSCPG